MCIIIFKHTNKSFLLRKKKLFNTIWKILKVGEPEGIVNKKDFSASYIYVCMCVLMDN